MYVHCRKDHYDVYVGRPSIFGNPFELGLHGDRPEVIEKFQKWLETGESFENRTATEEKRQNILRNVKSLKGKVLGCFCAPQDCHARILSELANKE